MTFRFRPGGLRHTPHPHSCQITALPFPLFFSSGVSPSPVARGVIWSGAWTGLWRREWGARAGRAAAGAGVRRRVGVGLRRRLLRLLLARRRVQHLHEGFAQRAGWHGRPVCVATGARGGQRGGGGAWSGYRLLLRDAPKGRYTAPGLNVRPRLPEPVAERSSEGRAVRRTFCESGGGETRLPNALRATRARQSAFRWGAGAKRRASGAAGRTSSAAPASARARAA